MKDKQKLPTIDLAKLIAEKKALYDKLPQSHRDILEGNTAIEIEYTDGTCETFMNLESVLAPTKESDDDERDWFDEMINESEDDDELFDSAWEEGAL